MFCDLQIHEALVAAKIKVGDLRARKNELLLATRFNRLERGKSAKLIPHPSGWGC